MDDEPLQNGDVPPAGEAIHLPDPSYLPVIVAAAVTGVLVGVVLNWWIFGLALAITIGAIARWIGQTRAEMAELPLDHGH
ncbi:MAG: aa3-type cytochrome oxidase subunit IV [Thermoleophilaceae bacterium]